MRFLPNGPWIPDDLLIARDEGRVVFFCGAGVSRSRANLPDFYELTDRVLDSLGALADSPARRLMAASKASHFESLGNLVSADRVFALLEREFDAKHIRAAVAMALEPKPVVDLTAHRLLLRLSRGADRKARLVTTNFDLLFEACDLRAPRSRPPNLPSPLRDEEFTGIIHLHGHVDDKYRDAAGDGFVLSSAEFGRAYLSEGWATEFIRAILERYSVVFVGYSADDPPVQYLLEALNRSSGPKQKNLYAFQSGAESEADGRWRHKGVQAIAYDGAAGHRSLWETLEAWAIRAEDPGAWAERLIRRSLSGPQKLLPHERGMVVHLVGTADGAGRFASSKSLPSSLWLCAFDPSIRYGKPGRINISEPEPIYFDPFEAYGLDSDPPPAKVEPDDHFSKRDIPSGVTDVFAATAIDHATLGASGYAGVRGHWAQNVPRLPLRLAHLGNWLARTALEPSAVWWAAGQQGLHPDIQSRILVELRKNKLAGHVQVRRAWRYLFEAWGLRRHEPSFPAYELKERILSDGWNAAITREYASLFAPFIKASRPYWFGPRPPEKVRRSRLGDLLSIEVEHGHPDIEIEVPDVHLPTVVAALRKNLEAAVDLERELGSYRLDHICPIEVDPDLAGESSERGYGISRNVLHYVALFRRLLERDLAAATAEIKQWRGDDRVVFDRLKIWSAGFPELVPNEAVAALLTGLAAEVFWGMHHRRDLLLVIAKRWTALPQRDRKQIERRFLTGPPRWRGAKVDDYRKHQAWAVLGDLYWLQQRGCSFSFDLETKTARFRRILPDWTPSAAQNAADSMEGRGGFVAKDTSFLPVLSEPLTNVLSASIQKSGYAHGRLIEADPFAGLSAERPVRALAAIRLSRDGQHVPWAWRSYLESQARQSDAARLVKLIACRLTQQPDGLLKSISLSASLWLRRVAATFEKGGVHVFYALFDRLVEVLKSDATVGASGILRSGEELNWLTEAINAPAGKLADVLMSDPNLKGLRFDAGLPADWQVRAGALLALPGDSGKYALTWFARNLDWLFAVDPSWAERELLLPMREGPLRDVALAGFFSLPRITGISLFSCLKPVLISLAVSPLSERRRHEQALANLLLDGWTLCDEWTGRRWVSSEELRIVLVKGGNNLRTSMLWRMRRWPSTDEKVVFLREVWPKQTTARNPAVTANLLDIAFGDESGFLPLADAVLPLVSRLDGANSVLPSLRHPESKILERYPEKTLSLLWAVLPVDPATWPYGAHESLMRIAAADEGLLKDERLVELMRRAGIR